MGRREHGRGISYICFCRMLVVKEKSQIIFCCSWIFWGKIFAIGELKTVFCVYWNAQTVTTAFHCPDVAFISSPFVFVLESLYFFIPLFHFAGVSGWNGGGASMFNLPCFLKLYVLMFSFVGKKMKNLSVLIIFLFLIVVK